MSGKAVLINDNMYTATNIINNHSTSMASFTTNRHFNISKQSQNIIDLSSHQYNLLMKYATITEVVYNHPHTEEVDRLLMEALICKGEDFHLSIKFVLYFKAMKSVSLHINRTSHYGKEYIKTCNPDVLRQDELIEFLICPCNEVSKGGSLLTHLIVAENFELLEKMTNHQYNLNKKLL